MSLNVKHWIFKIHNQLAPAARSIVIFSTNLLTQIIWALCFRNSPHCSKTFSQGDFCNNISGLWSLFRGLYLTRRETQEMSWPKAPRSVICSFDDEAREVLGKINNNDLKSKHLKSLLLSVPREWWECVWIFSRRRLWNASERAYLTPCIEFDRDSSCVFLWCMKNKSDQMDYCAFCQRKNIPSIFAHFQRNDLDSWLVMTSH